MSPHVSSSPEAPNGRHAGRLPWALAGALLLTLAFEFWVRAWPVERRIVYREDADQAVAVRHQIDAGPMPEVAFVGSSMTYQGIATPELERRLTAELGRPVRVGNFAIRGARIDLAHATVVALLRQPVKPRVIVVGIGMRDLRDHDLDLDRLSQLWTLADWRRESRARPLANELPQVIRNEVGRTWWTLRHRAAISLAAQQLFLDAPAEPMPARNQRPSQHEGNRREQSLADPVALHAFSRPTYKRRMMQAYRPELRATPPKILSDRVGRIIEDCRRSDVRLIFVDMPLSPPLRDLLNTAQRKTKRHDASRDFEPAYRKVMTSWTQRGGVPFVQPDRAGVAWTDADFYDGQHLNYAGALKLGEALAPILAAELK